MQKFQQETQIKDISHSIGDINFQLPILLDSETRVRMRTVGDVFTIPFEGKEIQLAVVPEFIGKNCFFLGKCSKNNDLERLLGQCSSVHRLDGTPIIFKKISQNRRISYAKNSFQ